jgi:hypothetical protein
MSLNTELETLLTNLDNTREELSLKLHLASMDVRDEFEAAEKQWQEIKNKFNEIADDSKQNSEEFIDKTKHIAKELEKTYQRILKIVSA